MAAESEQTEAKAGTSPQKKQRPPRSAGRIYERTAASFTPAELEAIRRSGKHRAFVDKKNHPARIGKANPVRDVLLFFTFIGLMLLFAWVNEDVGTAKPEDEKPPAKSMHQLQETLSHMIGDAIAGRKRRTDCGLFLHASSLPGTGVGLFAGNNYTEGQLLFKSSHALLPLKADDVRLIYFHPVAGILKHNPVLTNTETGTLWYDDAAQVRTIEVRASRDIQAGEELFVDFHRHPHKQALGGDNLFSSIPLMEDYEMADLMILDARNRLKARSYATPKKHYATIRSALSLGRLLVARYNNKVSQLLPSTTPELLSYTNGGSSVHLAVRNITSDRLAVLGRCLDDSHVPEASEDGKLVAQREIKAETVIMQVPILTVRKDASIIDTDEQSCPATVYDHCFQTSTSATAICPLAPGTFEFVERADTSITPNAFVQLSEESFHDVSLVKSSDPSAATAQKDSNAIQVIASRDIAVGEKIIVLNNEQTLKGLIATASDE